MTEAQILIGRDPLVAIAGCGQNFYQLMIDWDLRISSNYFCGEDRMARQLNTDAAQALAHDLVMRGVSNCRIYNGVRYNNQTKKFEQIGELGHLEETAIRQTLKVIGGVLVEK